MAENKFVRPGERQGREQRCTAPHPARSFLYFLGTLALVAVSFYVLRRLL